MKKLDKEFSESRRLREKGYSLKEISEKLGIAKSTASKWLSDFALSDEALERLEARKLLGRVRAAESNKKRGVLLREQISKEADRIISSIPIESSQFVIFCALLFECEGAKDYGSVDFINSDPLMISAFLYFLRNSFALEEKKFRVTMHLHEYHDEGERKKFWSKTANISQTQFTKTYFKPHTGKNYHAGYPGCIRVRYCDSRIARKLGFIAQRILEKYGSVR